MSGSQLHLRNESSFLADPWHSDALSVMPLEGPPRLDPLTESGRAVDVSPALRAVNEDHNITLPSAPANGTAGLGCDLNTDSIIGFACKAGASVALYLNTLAAEDHIVAVKKPFRILADPLGVRINLFQKDEQARLCFFPNLKAPLPILCVPI